MWPLKTFHFAILVAIVLVAITPAMAGTKALVNTPATSKEQKDSKCLLPKEPGPCRMRLERYYYNAETDSCETFVFGGCRGNENSFGFKETCEAACKKSPLTSKKMNPSTLKSLTSNTPITEKPTVASATSTTTTAKTPSTTTVKK
ncbi:kunitz-type serine protease inhibitor Hg1 isoform X2 [Musca domestica]|uniref:Kunitz-type serine protease inhibitor Hg1 isoform X2 n=1 Tax=Musca domestica TaxID=7370 RepID=A0A1I8NAK3_MUSDO|nr:kunitz-type serine protease inhibitor Hg1 isoform X2 [Musca domestica]